MNKEYYAKTNHLHLLVDLQKPAFHFFQDPVQSFLSFVGRQHLISISAPQITPKLSDLIHQLVIMSQFLWVRTLGAV